MISKKIFKKAAPKGKNLQHILKLFTKNSYSCFQFFMFFCFIFIPQKFITVFRCKQNILQLFIENVSFCRTLAEILSKGRLDLDALLV